MSNLFDIRENIQWLQSQAEAYSLEDHEELEGQLQQLELDRSEKIEEYIKIIKNLEADAEMFKAATQEFQKKKQRAEKNAKYLRDQIKYDLTDNGEHKKRVGHFTVGLGYTQGKVVITDEELISDDFKVTKVEVSKSLIKDHIKENGEIPDGVKIEKGVRVSIR